MLPSAKVSALQVVVVGAVVILILHPFIWSIVVDRHHEQRSKTYSMIRVIVAKGVADLRGIVVVHEYKRMVGEILFVFQDVSLEGAGEGFWALGSVALESLLKNHSKGSYWSEI